MTTLTPQEADEFDFTRSVDQLDAAEYRVARGTSGHAFASNGFSVVRDLTERTDVEADSIEEADAIVAGRSTAAR